MDKKVTTITGIMHQGIYLSNTENIVHIVRTYAEIYMYCMLAAVHRSYLSVHDWSSRQTLGQHLAVLIG